MRTITLLRPFLRVVLFPVALILKAMGIRFIYNCRLGGFGHIAREPSVLLKSVALGLTPPYHFVWLVDNPPANSYLMERWKEQLKVVENYYAAIALKIFESYPFLRKDVGTCNNEGAPDEIDRQAAFVRDAFERQCRMTRVEADQRCRFVPRLEMPEKDEEACRYNMAKLGVCPEEWFVVVHAREDRSYNPMRSFPLSTTFAASRFLREQGGKVVRLGQKGISPLSEDSDIIDYPNSDVSSPMMDVYLLSHQRFMIGAQSGAARVARLFHVPVLITNVLPWSQTAWGPGGHVLIKLISDAGGHLVSLQEYFDRELHLIAAGWGLPKGFVALDTTAEDLLEATKEMVQMHCYGENLFSGDGHVAALQKRWKESFAPWHPAHWSQSALSPSFLRKYENTLFPV